MLLSNSPCSDYVYVLLAVLSINNHNTVCQNIVKMIGICLCNIATHEMHLQCHCKEKIGSYCVFVQSTVSEENEIIFKIGIMESCRLHISYRKHL